MTDDDHGDDDDTNDRQHQSQGYTTAIQPTGDIRKCILYHNV